jgi:hypothetical protein
MSTQTLSKPAAKYLAIFAKGIIEEREIISMRSFMGKSKENAQLIFSHFPENGMSISDDQARKGYDFLMNQWKTPTGADRKNNPFGYREQNVLENYSHIILKSLYNAGNCYHDYYLPLYEVVAKDGSAFEYYYNGQINIVG